MRRELNTPLITKGLRRLRGLSKGGISKTSIAKGIATFDAGPLFGDSHDPNEVLTCFAKTINHNPVQVEKVHVANFQNLAGLCVLTFIVSFVVLILEKYLKVIT